jgi:hypothetical protein
MIKRRKLQVGTEVRSRIIQPVMKDGRTVYYWIEVPEGMTNEEAAKTQEWCGPFKTVAEADEDFSVVVFGPGSRCR